LKHLLQDEQLERDAQVSAAGAFVRLHPDSRLAAAALIPGISGGSADVVSRAIQAVLNQDTAQAAMVLGDIAQVATSAEQLRLAEQLAADGAGAESLLSLVAAGRMSARLLTRPTVRQRLEVIDRGALKLRLEELTSGLPSEDAAVEKLIRERRQGFAASPGQAEAGRELFKKHCVICHQVAGEGKKVGPNLDGIGGRGADRLVEDILAPNRNVDIAFRTTTVVTAEGKAFSGLLRDVEGDRISIIDSQGRETLLMNSDVDERVAGMQSPMPANVAEILSEEQIMHLLAYLVSLRH
jgi:putative heme-binding domain-containing protein